MHSSQNLESLPTLYDTAKISHPGYMLVGQIKSADHVGMEYGLHFCMNLMAKNRSTITGNNINLLGERAILSSVTGWRMAATHDRY